MYADLALLVAGPPRDFMRVWKPAPRLLFLLLAMSATPRGPASALPKTNKGSPCYWLCVVLSSTHGRDAPKSIPLETHSMYALWSDKLR